MQKNPKIEPKSEEKREVEKSELSCCMDTLFYISFLK